MKAVTVTHPAAATDHADRWKLITAAILAVAQAVEPVVVTLLPPKTAAIVDAATQLAPVVIQVVEETAA